MSPSSTSNSDAGESAAPGTEGGLIAVCPAPFAGRGRRISSWIALSFFAIAFAGTGIVDRFIPYRAPEAVGETAINARTRRANARVSDGTLMQLIESDLKANSRSRVTVLPFWSALLLYALRQPCPGVVIGPDNWLFLENRATIEQDNVVRSVGLSAGLIAAVDRRVAGVGSRLVVAAVPRKEAVYPEHLPAGVQPHAEYDQQLYAALAARGVEAPDLYAAFMANRERRLYFETDSHWSDRGADLTARLVSELPGVRHPAGLTTTLRETSRETSGDLLRMTGVTRADQSNPLHLTETTTVIDVLGRDGERVRDDGPAQAGRVVAIGTSFTANSKFRPLLRHWIGEEIFNAGLIALGPCEPLERFLGQLGARPGPEIIVWEIPNHYLFAYDTPLTDIADVFERAPARGYTSLATIGETGADRLLDPSTTLRRGPLDRTKPSPFVVTRPGILNHAADGGINLRLRGKVKGPAAFVAARCEWCRVNVAWTESMTEVVVPLVAHLPSSDVRFELSAPNPATSVLIDSAELVYDLDESAAITATPGSIQQSDQKWSLDLPLARPFRVERLAAARINLALDQCSGEAIDIAAVDDQGQVIALRTIHDLAHATVALIDLSPARGRTITALRLSGINSRPHGVVKDAAVMRRRVGNP